MLPLLRHMMREEWRMHSILLGNRSFSFFPIIMAILAFTASMLLPIYRLLLTSEQMAAVMHLIYLFFGLSVGGFGFMGQEALNRRLGDISLIAYASRTLPVSERGIFANFVLKDTIFYAFFLILPFFAAYAPSRLMLGLTLASVPYLAASLALTFLFGLSLSFAATTAYAHLGKALLAAVFAGTFAYSLHDPAWLSLEGLSSLLPPLQFYLHHSPQDAFIALALAFTLSASSIWALKVDYRLSARRYHNQYVSLVGKLGFGRLSPFVAKDLLDLNRSEGGIGKIFMSFGLPIVAVVAMVSFFSRLLPIETYHFMMLISLMTGLVSTSLYSWLTELDFEELYAFMPIHTSYIMASKLALYGAVSVAVGTPIIAASYSLLAPALVFLPAGLLLAASVAAYSVAVTAYLTGLKPNVMLYSGGVFALYVLAILPPLILPAVLFMTGYASQMLSLSLTALYAIVLLPASIVILRRSLVKWDAAEGITPGAV
ncbi:MAG: hypothetical protein V1875_08465 [Candidatus Altiarchaeota archaeon]